MDHMICQNCDKYTTNPLFCSRSCAAQVNNKKYPKRQKQPREQPSCSRCGAVISSGSVCTNCKKSRAYRCVWCKHLATGTFCSQKCEEDYHSCRDVTKMVIHDAGNGYKHLIYPHHPEAGSKGRVLLHRVLLEWKIGRYLNEDEVAHHIDEDNTNNDPANLEVKTRSNHSREHRLGKMHAEVLDLICYGCGISFTRYKSQAKSKTQFCTRSCAAHTFGRGRPLYSN